jgi:uncharacterized protein YecT (DUF1311 family)
MRKLLCSIGLLGLSLPVLAANCDQTRNSLDSVHCSNMIYQKADQELNSSYKLLRQKLNAADKSVLRTSQLAWIKQRDRQCTLNSVDMGEVIDTACLLDQTTSRTNWLNDRLRECKTTGCLSSKLSR